MIMSAIGQNLQAVREAIAASAVAAGRDPAAVSLLAVSKTFGADAVMAALAVGQTAFGENYLQEAVQKIEAVRLLQQGLAAGEPSKTLVEWHFIGPIQSNKTRQIASHFDWVHSVDRLSIAQRLSGARSPAAAPLNLCLQVNISGEASKSGVAPEDAPAIARQIAALPGVRLRGLMAIPEPEQDFERQRLPYRRLRALFEQMQADGLALDTLSIGMSADMAAAIAEGATMVRIGSAIFGARPAPTREYA
jgi:pyridoxal phosphate enzyme (YggS family)